VKSFSIVTCKSLLEKLGSPKFYSPTGARQGFYTLFRERTSSKFEWLAFFIIDPACFGKRPLSPDDLEMIQNHLGQILVNKISVSTVMETRVLPSYDPLGFARLNGEKDFTFDENSRARLWSMKGSLSTTNFDAANKTIIGHRLYHAEQREFAESRNITVEEKWFNDVRSNREHIRFGSLTRTAEGAFIFYHADTFTIPRLFEKRRFAVFGELTAFSSGRVRNVLLIDTAIFDGLLTSRILHFFFLLAQVSKDRHESTIVSSFDHERNMLYELIFKDGLSRLSDLRTKNMLLSFSAYSSSLSATMGYYEWTINPQIKRLGA
jgi:hypothetical protein